MKRLYGVQRKLTSVTKLLIDVRSKDCFNDILAYLGFSYLVLAIMKLIPVAINRAGYFDAVVTEV